jgi:hypothetical protein
MMDMFGVSLMSSTGMASGSSLFGLCGGFPPEGGTPQASFEAGLAGCGSGALHQMLDIENLHN